MALSKHFALFVSALLLVSQAICQDHENIRQVAQFPFNDWNSAEALAIYGDLLFVVDADSGLRIVEMSRPISPHETALFPYDAIVYDVAASGRYAYIAGEEGLVVINVQDPSNPQEVAVFGDAGELRGITVDGNYAYASVGRNGIRILDISDPAEIEALGGIDTPGFAIRTLVSDGFAYVADRGGGMRVIDIEDPSDPVEVGSIEPRGETRDVVKAGNYVYAGETEGLSRIDVSNPENPQRTGFLEFQSPILAVACIGNYVYAAAGDHGLSIIPIPGMDEEIGLYYLYSSVVDVAMSGNYAFIVCRERGLQIVDITDSAEPVKAADLGTPAYIQAVAVTGDYAFLSKYPEGIIILNVSNPFVPYITWQDISDYNYLRDIVIDRIGYLYTVGDFHSSERLSIADISDPEDLQWLSEFGVWDDPNRITASGSYLYISCNYGTDIMNITDRSSPEHIARIAIGRDHKDVALSGDLAFIAASRSGDSGLIIVNIADPHNTRHVSTYNPETRFYSIEIRGNHAFLGRYYGVEVVDISNPRDVSRVGFCDLPGTVTEIILVNDYACVADGQGLHVLNIADPTDPHEVGFYDTPGTAKDIAVSGSLVFVADDSYFGIYDCSDCLTVPDADEVSAVTFALDPAYPNPFNDMTSVRFSLAMPGHVTVDVYDISGRLVTRLIDGMFEAGSHSTVWRGSAQSAGVYIVRLESDGFSDNAKVLLLK